MDFKEILPIIALRRFDAICLHNEYLHKNKEFQQQILSWATDMLAEAREQWGGTHSTTIDAIVTEYRKRETINMHRLGNILSKFKKKDFWNIKRQDLY